MSALILWMPVGEPNGNPNAAPNQTLYELRAVNLVTNAITVSPQTSNTSARVQPLESTTTYRIEVRAIKHGGCWNISMGGDWKHAKPKTPRRWWDNRPM